jgi:hypothetical protein
MSHRHLAFVLPLLAAALCPGFALAEDEGGDLGLGPMAATNDAGHLPGGFLFGSPNGETNLSMWWARADDERIRLQGWQLDVGSWGPSPGMNFDEPVLPMPRAGDGAEDADEDDEQDTPPEDEGSAAMVMSPYFVLGGDRARGERFRFRTDINWQWNLASYGGVPLDRFNVGPLMGMGWRLLYPHKDAADPHASGGVHLVGGFAIGGCISRVVHLRTVARVAWDPFVDDIYAGEGGALLGLDLRRFGAPLGMQLSGMASQELSADFEPGWRASVALMHIP